MFNVSLLRRSKAFTLLEVLVALAVIAIALGAAVRLSGDMINTTQNLKQRTVARWIAQNRLNLHLASNDWPAIGSLAGEEEMAGMSFHWQEDVSNTPNKYYRRIELRVYNNEDRDFALVSLIGYLHETQN